MSNMTRAMGVFNNLAGVEMPSSTIISYVDAVIAERALDGRDPSRPEIEPPVLKDDQKAALFLNWLRQIIRQHRIEEAAKPSLTAAENARKNALNTSKIELGEDDN